MSPAPKAAAARSAPEPPQNLEAEEYVLGACMLSRPAVDACSEIIEPADFYRATHGLMFEAILTLYNANEATDAIMVARKLESTGKLKDVGGKERIQEIATLVPATSNAAHHARIVREMAVLRMLADAGAGIYRGAMSRERDTADLVEDAEQSVFDITKTRHKSEAAPIGASLMDTIREIEAVYDQGGRTVTGVETGFKTLDELTSGLQLGNLIVVAGRPSMGKTALGLAIATHAALHNEIPVALFTLEMSRSEIERRVLSSEAMIESQKIHKGTLSGEEWGRLMHAASRVASAPLLIDDSSGLRVTELRSKARRLKLRNPKLGLIVVDYLQLMSGGGSAENRVQEVSQISRMLKVLAGELDIPVVAMSQLSRQVEQRHDKRPILSDLRDSGSIEQDADVVAFVYRDEYYHPEDTDQEGIAEVNIAKQRNGPVGTAKLAFVKRYAKFSTLVRAVPPAT